MGGKRRKSGPGPGHKGPLFHDKELGRYLLGSGELVESFRWQSGMFRLGFKKSSVVAAWRNYT